MALIHDRWTLAADLTRLGLAAGRDVLVHASMRQIGRIEGGAAALAHAILDIIGPTATLVVPTQTAGNSTTSRAYRHATKGMDDAERAAYEESIAGFDPATSPSHDMGALAEYVRRHPDSVRSAHPQTSFAALGRSAAQMMAVHDLDSHLGERSPLAALYATDAQVLLLGVGYDVCIAFHLAEYRLPVPVARRAYTCFVMRDERRVRVDFEAEDIYDHDFGALGAALARTGEVRTGRVGDAVSAVVAIRPAVDFAIGWLGRHRGRTGSWRSDDDPFSLA
jgi:aminoglycoside 3-N-acetyltransferase